MTYRWQMGLSVIMEYSSAWMDNKVVLHGKLVEIRDNKRMDNTERIILS